MLCCLQVYVFLSRCPWTANFVWQDWHYKMISAMLPSSLQALSFAGSGFAGSGRVSFPDLKHLTALTPPEGSCHTFLLCECFH